MHGLRFLFIEGSKFFGLSFHSYAIRAAAGRAKLETSRHKALHDDKKNWHLVLFVIDCSPLIVAVVCDAILWHQAQKKDKNGQQFQ